MSQSSINASQKEPKESGTCGTYYGSFRLLRRDGTFSKHGSWVNPCHGSYTAPSSGPTYQRAAWTATDEDHSSNASTYGRPITPLQTTVDAHTLSHPPWSMKINRIPRAADVFSCTSLRGSANLLVVSRHGKNSCCSPLSFSQSQNVAGLKGILATSSINE